MEDHARCEEVGEYRGLLAQGDEPWQLLCAKLGGTEVRGQERGGSDQVLALIGVITWVLSGATNVLTTVFGVLHIGVDCIWYGNSKGRKSLACGTVSYSLLWLYSTA